MNLGRIAARSFVRRQWGWVAAFLVVPYWTHRKAHRKLQDVAPVPAKHYGGAAIWTVLLVALTVALLAAGLWLPAVLVLAVGGFLYGALSEATHG